MLVAAPGQTASYSTIHNTNSSSNVGGSNGTTAAAAANGSATKKSSTLNSTNGTTSGTAKSANNGNNHTTSIINSLISNTQHSTALNYNANPKNDNIVSNKLINQNKTTATSSREIISSTKPTATHSLRSENSTNSNNTISTTLKQQSFIQTLKDSVQKALISTTGSSTNNNSIVNKYSSDSKLKNSCNNSSTTSINNVTSSSSSTSLNTNKVSTTTSSNNSSNSTAVTQSSSTMSAVVRSKHFSLSKLHTVAPTVLHRYPEERQNASSTDSLQKEMCHFKPIRIVPKTPWKSGSKSRGNSLRFPKANLATNKIEFVLKSNCDVNNRKKKQQLNRTQNDKINIDEELKGDGEQENKEIHGIYKPKPSLTCLSTTSTSTNHQSAFVCLVAQMNLSLNLKSKRQLTPSKSTGAIMDLLPDESMTELYVRKKQKSAKKQHKEVGEETLTELSTTRSTRSSSNVKNKRVSRNTNNNHATTKKEAVKLTNAKSNIPKGSNVAITKAKSRMKLGRAKSKTAVNTLAALSTPKAKETLQNSVSMAAVAGNKNKTTTVASRKSITRKRKIAQTINDPPHQPDLLTTSSTSTPLTSVKSQKLLARKSSRLSTRKQSPTTDTLNNYQLPNKSNSQQTTIKLSQKSAKNSTVVRFSPPLTRSRLKQLAEQGKLLTTSAAVTKKRKI